MTNKLSYPLAILTVFCLLALPAVAATGGSLAQLAGGPSGVSFILDSGNYESVTITINGPGDLSLRDTFAAGTAPVFSVFDAAGNLLPDGTYTYELRAQPRLSGSLRGELEAARAAGDTGAAARLRASGQLPDKASLVQSGTFSITGGSVVIPDPSIVEKGLSDSDDGSVPSKAPVSTGIPTKAQVFTTDLIVQSSTCTGFDCNSGESFGSDTLRLKENNLRIHFDDTSSSGSFPSNDWRLIANDTANGGASYFAIEDSTGGKTPFRIEAGAPNNAAYVEDDGDFGVGTAAPVVDVHAVDGNTPTLRLEQDGSSGFTPQTWDIAGNEANFFIRDVTNGSKLSFRIKPGAPEDSLFIDANGDIGLGTETPNQKLDVVGGDLQVKRTDGSISSLFITSEGGTNPLSYNLRTNQSVAGVGGFTITSGGTSPFRVFNGAANQTLDVTTGGVTMRSADNSSTITLDNTGVAIVGGLTVDGTNVPDYVFEPDFPVETIEEHASFMWTNKHLPAVEPAQFDEAGRARIDLGDNQMGMLEELEKAHVYIDQLNDNLKDKDEEIAALKTMTEELATRLARLEAEQN